MKKPKPRVYIVRAETGIRLVRAFNKAAALRYAARTTMTVALATQDDIINAMSKQIPIDDATVDHAADERE